MIVKDKKEFKVIENNETFKMSCDDKHIILESNDKNGITVYPDRIIWSNLNQLFSKLFFTNNKNVKKYEDYLVGLSMNGVRFSLVKDNDNYIFSVISPLERKIKIPLNSEIGIILFEFYNSIINMNMDIEQITMAGYMYSLKHKNVNYNKKVSV